MASRSVIAALLLSALACKERVTEPLELPFDLSRVTIVTARGMRVEDRRPELPGHPIDPTSLTEARPLDHRELAALARTLTHVVSADMPDAMCFAPHHFLELVDADGAAVAHIDVCFTCETIAITANGSEKRFGVSTNDSLALADIFVAAQLTNYIPDAYYARYPRYGTTQN